MSTSNGANQVIRLPSSVSTIQHIRLPTVNATAVAGLQQVRMPVTSGISNKQVINTIYFYLNCIPNTIFINMPKYVIVSTQVQYIRLVPTTAASSLASSPVSVVTTTAVTVPPKQPQIVSLSSTSTSKPNVKTTTVTKTSTANNNQQPIANHIKVFSASPHVC